MKTNFTMLITKKLLWGAFLFLLISLSAISAFAADKNTYLFTVSTTHDTGPGSLRAAIDSANLLVANPDVKVDRPVVVTFDPAVFDGTSGSITLASGDITIANHIWIYNSSASASDVTIDGAGVTPVPDEGGIFNVPNMAGPDGYSLHVTIENITFANGKAKDGGAVYNETVLNLKGVAFTGNEATLNGGGAVYNKGLLTIYDGTFTANKFTGNDERGKGGGAIYNESAGELYIKEGAGSGTDFAGNESTNYGGAMWNEGLINIAGTTFDANLISGTAASGLKAGALYNKSTNPLNVIKDSEFKSNKNSPANPGIFGGAIHNDNGVLTISHSVFDGNESNLADVVGGGGAIFNDGTQSSDATVTQLTINDGCVFRNNKGFDEGGAISSWSATLNISDSKFENNTLTALSPRGGGAIATGVGTMAFDGYVNLTNVEFMGNTSPTSGGAIRLTGQNSILAIVGGKFENNEAGTGTSGSGGAIFNFNSTKPLNITGTVFKGNTAKTDGGAIESTASMTDCKITITNCLFENNKAAGQNGGAIDVANSILVLTNTDFINNEVGSVTGGTTSGQGGAVKNDGTSITIDGGTFANNKAYHKSSDNTGGQGGAIYNSNTSTMTVRNALFTGNKTTGNNNGGGAIYTANAAYNAVAKRDIIVNSVFENNTTTANGGAINAYCGINNLIIAHSTIKNNTAEIAGGGIYARYTDGAIILNSRVLDNKGASNADDNVNAYMSNTVKAAYSTFGEPLAKVGEITGVTGTNNALNIGTLAAKDASGNVYFADLTANLWRKADGTTGTPAFSYDAASDYGLAGATLYANYIGETVSRIITTPSDAIDVNGALADAAGNAAPVPGGVILTAFDAAASSVTWSWTPALDDATAASALTYKVYQSATSPIDVSTATPETTLTGTTTYTSTDLSRPYFTVVVEDGDATPLNASYQEATDVVAPIVTDVIPANAATGLAIDGTIDITFSKDIATAGKVFLNDIELTGTLTLAGATCQIPYSGLAYGTHYTIRIEGFQDAASNVLTTNKDFSFTTLSAASAMGDAVKPKVARTYNNSADSIYITGATSGNIAITFNEPMSTIYGAVTLNKGVGTLPLAGTWSADSTTYTIRYNGLTTDTEYFISIHDFRDIAGNIMEPNNDPENKFTAGGDDITAPSVSLAGIITSEVGRDKMIFTFSESMDGADIPAFITLAPAGITFYYPGYWSDNNTVYTIACDDFVSSQEYAADFTGFRDAACNELPPVVGLRFTPGAPALPRVLSVSPANNATDVAISGNIVITFSEAMDKTVEGIVVLDDGTTPVTLNATAATWAGNAYTIPYSALANSTAYTVQISGFKNTASDEMLPNNSNSFTTISSTPPPATTYTLTFDADGGSVSPATLTVTEGIVIGTLPEPTRAGYIFNGWFTEANGLGTQYTASTIATGNVTLYAAWVSVPTGVEELSDVLKVWSSGGQLYIRTPQAEKVRIYTLTGKLYKQLVVPANEMLNLPLAKGFYIVVFESGVNQKVMVR